MDAPGDDDGDAEAAVLRALRAASGTLSSMQIAGATGLDPYAVDDVLVRLQLQQLAHCVEAPRRQRPRPRTRRILWRAARPDLA